MTVTAPEHRPGYVYHYDIHEEPYFLSEKDIGTKFVTMRFYKGWAPKGPFEKDIRAGALKLIAYNKDHSMLFQDEDGLKIKFKSKDNDGLWISDDKCVQLFKENSPKIELFYLSLGGGPSPF